MNQFFWSADNYDIGETPSDAWFNDAGTFSSWNIEEDDAGKFLHIVASAGTQRRFLSFIPVGIATGVSVFALLKYRDTGAGAHDFAVLMNASNLETPNTTNADRIDYFNANRRISWYANGNFDGGANTAISNSTFLLRQLRATKDVSGVLRRRDWLFGEDEPDDWEQSRSGSPIGNTGKTGIFVWDRGLRLYAFGVGVNGAPAPSGPVGVIPTLLKPEATIVTTSQIGFKIPVEFQ